jgi:hypothetical protein
MLFINYTIIRMYVGLQMLDELMETLQKLYIFLY